MPDRLLLKGAENYVEELIDRIPDNSPIFDKKNNQQLFRKELSSEELYRPITWRVVNLLVWQNKFKTTL
jgi:hypothetical protein